MSKTYYQSEVLKLKKYNDKIEKEAGGTYLWDFEEASRLILLNMKEEAGLNPIYYCQLAYFIALRLKFADEKTIFLMKEALYHHKKYYNETLDGENFIYDAMQEGLDYFGALLGLYRLTEHAKNSDLPTKIRMVDTGSVCAPRFRYLYPTEDGKHLVELSEEEYHEKYGLTKFEIINQPPSEEWTSEFDKFNKLYADEIEEREKKYKKKFRKWSQQQKNELHEYMAEKRKEFNL